MRRVSPLDQRRSILRFELTHHFDVSLQTLEEALLHPDCTDFLVARMDAVKRIEILEQDDDGTVLRRKRRVVPNPPPSLPAFAKGVKKDMLQWTEVATYDRSTHSFHYENIPNIPVAWRKFFSNTGSYTLEEETPSRTRRIIKGVLELRVPILGRMGEKLIWKEVERTFEQEYQAFLEFLQTRFGAK